MTAEPLLIIISSPSGGGKTTICKMLMGEPSSPLYGEAVFSISATTRAIRAGEKDGKDYFFLTKEKFREMIAEGEFLEYAEVFGNLYGTPQAGVSAQKHTLFDIDFQGHHQIKKKREVLSIFLLPPSLEVLEERVRKRGDIPLEALEARIKKAPLEIEEARFYDYILINGELSQTFKKVCAIIEAEILKKETKALQNEKSILSCIS